MPFDGVGFPSDPALEKIDRVIELLAVEERWCKGIVRSSDGRMCLVGALIEADARPLLEPVLREAVRKVTGRTPGRLERFNDAQATTHAVVLAVLDRAREDILTRQAPARTLSRRLGWACKGMADRLRWW